MTAQKSGAALPSLPTNEPSREATVLPQIIHRGDRSVKLAANDVEQFLSQVWDEPALVVQSHIGGIGPAYYARSEGHWIGLDRGAEGFALLVDTEESDYGFHHAVKYALERGVA